MAELRLKIVTPEKQIFDDEVNMVTATTSEGEIGILPHHTNLMTTMLAGELKIRKGDKEIVMATGGGLLQMANNILSIATDLAENVEDIDEKVVEQARERAQTALETKLSEEEYAETLAMLEKSLAQLRVKRRHKVK